MAAKRSKKFWGREQFRGYPSKQHFSSKLKGKTSPNPTRPNNSNCQCRTRGKLQQETRTCHKCGQKGHLANDCWTNEYFVNMYKKLQHLKSKQREAFILDAPTLNDTGNYIVTHTDLENIGVSSRVAFMDIVPRVSLHATNTHLEVALLNSATTHTILRDPLLFNFFKNHTDAWQTCQMHTIAGRRDFKFREGWANIILHVGTTFMVEKAMYAP